MTEPNRTKENIDFHEKGMTSNTFKTTERTAQLEKEIEDRESDLELEFMHTGNWNYDDVLKAELKGRKEMAEEIIEILDGFFYKGEALKGKMMTSMDWFQLKSGIKKIGGLK